MPVVRFAPLDKSWEVKAGATILSAAIRCRVAMGYSCEGEGICGWCRVTVLQGRNALMPPDPLEQRLIEEKQFGTEERAACLARVSGDVTVTTTYW